MGTLRLPLSSRSVFLVTFVLALPPDPTGAFRIREGRDRLRAGARLRPREATRMATDERPGPDASSAALLIFACSMIAWGFAGSANPPIAGERPLMAAFVPTRSSQLAPVLIAALHHAFPQAERPRLHSSASVVCADPRRHGVPAPRTAAFLCLVCQRFGALAMSLGLLFATCDDPYCLVAVYRVFRTSASTAAVFCCDCAPPSWPNVRVRQRPLQSRAGGCRYHNLATQGSRSIAPSTTCSVASAMSSTSSKSA